MEERNNRNRKLLSSLDVQLFFRFARAKARYGAFTVAEMGTRVLAKLILALIVLVLVFFLLLFAGFSTVYLLQAYTGLNTGLCFLCLVGAYLVILLGCILFKRPIYKGFRNFIAGILLREIDKIEQNHNPIN